MAELRRIDTSSLKFVKALGVELRETGGDGFAYPSVRCADGECSALFYPDVATNVRELRFSTTIGTVRG